MNAAALEQIELKIAFLERANTELSDVVYRQQREIEALQARVASLQEAVKARGTGEAVLTPEQERPPHY